MSLIIRFDRLDFLVVVSLLSSQLQVVELFLDLPFPFFLVRRKDLLFVLELEPDRVVFVLLVVPLVSSSQTQAGGNSVKEHSHSHVSSSNSW